mgnify:CR=1 FL=1
MLQVKIGGDEMQYGAEKNIYDLKDLIMEYLDNPSQRYKKYKFNQLRSKMCGELGYRVDMLRVALEELELEGKIEVDKTKGLFRSFPHDLGYVHGILSINKHDEGFIMGRDGKKYKIKTEDLNDALDGDTVVVKPTKKMSEGHVVCKVDKIIKRKDGLIHLEIHAGNQVFNWFFPQKFHIYVHAILPPFRYNQSLCFACSHLHPHSTGYNLCHRQTHVFRYLPAKPAPDLSKYYYS